MDRDSLTTRLRTSVLAAVLIGVLAWYTKWPSLRLGLLILLVGQLALAIMLFVRKRTGAFESSILKRLSGTGFASSITASEHLDLPYSLMGSGPPRTTCGWRSP